MQTHKLSCLPIGDRAGVGKANYWQNVIAQDDIGHRSFHSICAFQVSDSIPSLGLSSFVGLPADQIRNHNFVLNPFWMEKSGSDKPFKFSLKYELLFDGLIIQDYT